MNVYGPYYNSTHRIQPIDERPEDRGQQNQEEESSHAGHRWKKKQEAEIDPSLPSYSLDPSFSSDLTLPHEIEAKELLKSLTTLEERVAQLCFYQTAAVYDMSVQQYVELLIQAWQIGGLLFTKGQYRRQSYLIQRYQELSKTPLLIGNDLMHGLSFYFEGDDVKKSVQTRGIEKRFSDLGKAVMGLNRRIAVHFQFDRERGKELLEMDDGQIREFRHGVRQGMGVVALQPKAKPPQPVRPHLSFPVGNLALPFSQSVINEQVGFTSLHFLDCSEKPICEESLFRAFQEGYDAFLFGPNIQDAIRVLCKGIKRGRISEAEIERRVLKVLAMKIRFAK